MDFSYHPGEFPKKFFLKACDRVGAINYSSKLIKTLAYGNFAWAIVSVYVIMPCVLMFNFLSRTNLSFTAYILQYLTCRSRLNLWIITILYDSKTPIEFHASAQSSSEGEKYILAIVDGHVVTRVSEQSYPHKFLLTEQEADQLAFFLKSKITLGQWRGNDCEVWDLLPEVKAVQDFQWVDLRSLLADSSDMAFCMASRAVQLLEWSKGHKYCSRCGGLMDRHPRDHAMQCKACAADYYPRISPCIIVIVTYQDKCLLARQAQWPVGRYSALAGFIEAGESAEQAVFREVYEEVGLEIENIRYVGSQSWPFPGQLMLGYIASAKSQHIRIDGVEISDAQWWHYQQLPEFIPPPTIMAGRLIQTFVEEVSKQ